MPPPLFFPYYHTILFIRCLFIFISFTDAPACRSPQRQYSHAVAKHEAVEVSCDVEADPQDVSFAWSFHQGHRNLKLATNAFSVTTPNSDSNSARSVLLYTPKTDADYGSLFCLARNAVGESAEPCVFQVIPVGKDPFSR